MYRSWLASVSLHCGWEVECEVLRIPSTRNWAVIGRHLFRALIVCVQGIDISLRYLTGRRRTPWMEEEEAIENARVIVRCITERGLFKARKPEGKGDTLGHH